MTPFLPIPTDNIYKFACLFGLALIIASIFSYVSVYTSSLDRKIRYMEVVISIEGKSDTSKAEAQLLQLNKKLLEVTKSNERTASTLLGAVLVTGLSLSVWGASSWHRKIQRRDDRLAALQIAKLEAELKAQRH